MKTYAVTIRRTIVLATTFNIELENDTPDASVKEDAIWRAIYEERWPTIVESGQVLFVSADDAVTSLDEVTGV